MSNVTLCRSKFCFPSTNVPFFFLRRGACDAFLQSQGIAVKLVNASRHRTEFGFISMNADFFNGFRQSYFSQSWTSEAQTLGIHDDMMRCRHGGRFYFGLLPAVITIALAVLYGDWNFIRISSSSKHKLRFDVFHEAKQSGQLCSPDRFRWFK